MFFNASQTSDLYLGLDEVPGIYCTVGFVYCIAFLAAFITWEKHGKSLAVCGAICQGFGP